jgi:hypothetical protein
MFAIPPLQTTVQNNMGYRLGIVLLCLCYIIFQLVYIPYSVLARDELWFAHHIYQYTQHIPYRDFAPYKTVLGYYLLSMPLYFFHGMLAPLYYIKDEIAIINACAIGGIALWSSQWFQPRAMFYTLLIIISSQLFLIYSADLRVDMLASWLCLISILLLLGRRTQLAGFFLALGFLVSQQVLWYVVATNGAFVIYGLAARESRKTVRAFLEFNLSLLATVLLYVGIWSCFSNMSTVLHSVFYEAYTQSKITFYGSAYHAYWGAILKDGPLLILLWPLTLLSLFDVKLREHPHSRRVFIVAYSLLAILVMMTYKQLFPYNIVFFVPAFFVLYAEFFTWLLALFNQPQAAPALTLSSRQLFWFFSFYIFYIVGMVINFSVPLVYLAIIVIPVASWIYLENKKSWRVTLALMIMMTVLLTGIFLPLVRTSVYAYTLNGQYQRDMILLTHELLHDQEEYVAGVPLLYNKDQTIAGLKNLIAPAVQYLYTPEPALLPVLLPALDMEPRSVEQVLQDLQTKPVKLLVNNDRIANLPPRILNYLRSEFQHYWGGVYLYSPTVKPDQHAFQLKFSARYKVEPVEMQPVVIDGEARLPHVIVTLASGQHRSSASVAYRLRLVPTHLDINPDPSTFHDCPACFAKPIVY